MANSPRRYALSTAPTLGFLSPDAQHCDLVRPLQAARDWWRRRRDSRTNSPGQRVAQPADEVRIQEDTRLLPLQGRRSAGACRVAADGRALEMLDRWPDRGGGA
ncbi:hypothetical protein E2562_008130 [Oryza meyeriana var. granulata]|uniref:Uncharacterized protein n=1 Tax=Oryza meyeriana var. granulata TaxID=110450 RepID=A0A6G1CG03_9ORYZ|nr:hypothetical protein E2562_008130 [Oryza meyeriana var. granulata]